MSLGGSRFICFACPIPRKAWCVPSMAGATGIPYTRSRSGRTALFCRDPDGNALEFIEIETD